MKCLICKRNEKQVLLIKLPVEITYEENELHILGNIKENEYMCLPCVGFQYDEVSNRAN